MLTRRLFAAAFLSVLSLPIAAPVAAQSACVVRSDDFKPVRSKAFNAWVDRFQSRARKKGIKAATLKAGLRGGGYLPDVIKRDRSQFQKRRTLEDYISVATSDARIAQGRKMMGRHSKLFNALAAKYGVDPYTIAAIWGMESRFGERRGDVPVISATATLAFEGRRQKLYEQQLIGALKILQRGDVSAKNLTGSWAGAMGHTQFIPTSYLSFAVDFDRNGKRDVWGDDPTDALASTAAYLARNGWRKGLSWGGETGVTKARGKVIRPQAGGPRFTTTHNFRVLKRYNNSDAYAISVGVLSDRLRGQGPLRGGFPKDARGMSKADRLALQNRLNKKGYKVGDADGVIGPKTRCAIEKFQKRKGMKVNGEPSLAILKKLR